MSKGGFGSISHRVRPLISSSDLPITSVMISLAPTSRASRS